MASSRDKESKLPLFLHDLFYENKGNSQCRFTRSRKVKGLTRSCYIAQKLFMIRYILIKYYKYNFNLYHDLENVIYNITSQSPDYATQFFSDQAGQKISHYINQKNPICISRIKHLVYLFSAQLDSPRSTILTADNIASALVNSTSYPIPMAFGFETTRGSTYDIDHWFILYNKRLYGATGLGDVQISFYGSDEIAPAAFATFLNSMNHVAKTEEEKSAKKVIFDSFIKSNFLSLNYSIQTYKKKLKRVGSDDDKEVDTNIPIDRASAIKHLLDSYTKLDNYRFYMLNGFNDETYSETMRLAVECLVPIINQGIEQYTKNPLGKRDSPLPEAHLVSPFELYEYDYGSTSKRKASGHSPRGSAKSSSGESMKTSGASKKSSGASKKSSGASKKSSGASKKSTGGGRTRKKKYFTRKLKQQRRN